MSDKPERDPFDDVKAVDFKPPAGWRRVNQAGMDQLSALYIKKNFRLAASKIFGVKMVSISRSRHGRPGPATPAQCEETLAAFGLKGLEEVQMGGSARYFREPSDKP